jgi:hypothetical protein
MQSTTSTPNGLRITLGLIAVALLLSVMAFWGGDPIDGPGLLPGIAILLGIYVAFGLVIGWLYFSPMDTPVHPRDLSPRAVHIRQVLVVLIAISGLLMHVSATWDESWHLMYGGFGSDFLWPPHLLLYTSFALMALVAGGSLLALGRGSGASRDGGTRNRGIRQRFREEPVIGLLGLMACLLVSSAPSDEIWHRIYGIDITGWSLPHVLLGLTFGLVMLSAVAIQLSLTPQHGWRTLRGMHWQEALALMPLLFASAAWLLIGTIDYDTLSTVVNFPSDAAAQIIRTRPEWTYVAVIAIIALLTANIALHATRRAGTATIVALLVVILRFGEAALMDGIIGRPISLPATPHLMMIAPAVALDLWYALRLPHAQSGRTQWIGSIIASAAFLTVGLPLIRATLFYPRVMESTLPGMIISAMLIAPLAGWMGAGIGGWLGSISERPQQMQQFHAPLRWATAAAALTLVAAVVLYMRIAPPPMQ